jgi:TM2 domain-containing membrane protein YozV
MSSNFIAFLLSGFIFPGIGQIYKGEAKKGVFLLLSTSLLLAVLVLGVVISYSYAYAELLSQVTSPEAIVPEQMHSLLLQVITRPPILFTFGLLLATWVYGILDALRRSALEAKGE